MSKVTIKATDRKKSMARIDVGKAARKQSIYPAERKLSVDPSVLSDERNSFDALAQRRKSVYAERRMSIVGDIRRPSVIEPMAGRSALITTSAQGLRPLNVKYENTYKHEPDSKVSNDEIRTCIKEAFEEELPGKKYDEDECGLLSKGLAEVIKQKVKAIVQRYKIITVVAVGQRQSYSPSVAFTSRCVWNAKFDTFSEYTFKNKYFYAVGLVYVLYAE